MATLEYRLFKHTHPAWNGPYWELLETHARGGGESLKNDRFMRECLRRNLVENAEVWNERKARAVLKPYAGEIIGQLAATVFTDPLTVQVEADGEEPEAPEGDWDAWLDDTARPGTADPVPLVRHMRLIMDRLLINGIAYTLGDFMPQTAEAVTMAQAEALGSRWPYLAEIDPCAVTEWEDDDAGDLLWAMIRSVEAKRKALTDDRSMVTLTFRILTRDDWQLWAITYDSTKKPDGPYDQDPVTMVGSGAHSFGRVPLVRHRVPNNLWAMDRMYPLLNDLFRGSSGYSWIRDKTNCPTPFLKMQNLKHNEETVDAAVESSGIGRGAGAPRHVGEIAVLGERDELGWSAPAVESLKEAREGNDAARTELYRVMDAMAQAIDPSAASNKQSGESKAMDSTSKAVLAKAFGEVVRDGAKAILRMVVAGMGAEPTDWVLGGCDEVEVETAGEAVADLSALELVTLPAMLRTLEIKRFMRLRGYSETQIEQAAEEMDEQLAVDQEAEAAAQAASNAMAGEVAKNPKAALTPKKPAMPGKAKK